MDSIKDLLPRRRAQQPPEIEVIKSFMKERFEVVPSVTMQQKQIVIGVSSAALAGSLRMHLHELQKLCQTEKRLVIRIG